MTDVYQAYWDTTWPRSGERWSLRVVTPPAVEPVSVADAKRQCRIATDETSEDELLKGYLKAAREKVEADAELALVTQARLLSLDRFAAEIHIPCAPLAGTPTIQYVDAAGLTQTLTSFQADLNARPARLRPTYGQAWPATRWQVNAVSITFVCGYGTPADVPEMAKQAIRLLVGHWYANREAVLVGMISKEIEFAYEALLNALRWH